LQRVAASSLVITMPPSFGGFVGGPRPVTASLYASMRGLNL
jgi:hypothetical protein